MVLVKRKRKGFRVEWYFWVLLLIIIGLVVWGCDLIPLPSPGDDGDNSSGTIDCWWQLISEADVDVLPLGYKDFVHELPVGDYKFDWRMGDYVQNVQIIHGSASIKRFLSQEAGDYEFRNDFGFSSWGIGLENPRTFPVVTHLRLFQRVCEGDVLDWSIDFFGKPNLEYGEEQNIFA